MHQFTMFKVLHQILKLGLAYFSTKRVTLYQVMPTFWEAVAVLELTCKL